MSDSSSQRPEFVSAEFPDKVTVTPAAETPLGSTGSHQQPIVVGLKDSAAAGLPDQKTVISQQAPLAHAGQSTRPADMGRSLEGQQLGHFRLEEFVGGGGMGAVFRAVDTTLGRTVAVKVVGSVGADDDTLRRFRNEAQSAARLDHENIARVYYVGEDAGWNYIVFEFIEGVNIRDLVEHKGPLSLDDAVTYAMQVADALDHASLRDVVHRDIKPSNVLVTTDGRAKLVDMGLARLHQVESSSEDLTASGVTLGTFDYISPEQARDPRATDVRSDLYSLGCTFYFMLTGFPPFPHGTVLQKLLSHSSEEPPDPSQYRDDLNDELLAIINKLLAKNPRDRYQDPRELIVDLKLLAEQLGLKGASHAGKIWIAPVQPRESFLERHLPWIIPVTTLVAAVVLLDQFTRSTEPPEIAPPALGTRVVLATPDGPTDALGGSDDPGRPPTVGDSGGRASAPDPRTLDNERDVPAIGTSVQPPPAAPLLSKPGDEPRPDIGATPDPAGRTSFPMLPTRELPDSPTRSGAPGTGAPGTGTSGTAPSAAGSSGTGAPEAESPAVGTSGTGPSAAGTSGTGASGPGLPGPGLPGIGVPGIGASGVVGTGPAEAVAGPSLPTLPNVTSPPNATSPLDSTTPPSVVSEAPVQVTRLVVGSEGLELPAGARRVESLKRALLQVADLPEVTHIELRYDGPQVIKPPVDFPPDLFIGRDLTLEAGEGYAPEIVFRPRPEDLGAVQRPRMVRVYEGGLSLIGVHLSFELPADDRQGWSLFYLDRVSSLHLEDATLTIRNRQGAILDDQVAFFELSPPRESDAPPLTDPLDDPRPVVTNLSLLRCCARGQATLIRAERSPPLRLSWQQGFFSTTQGLLDVGGLKDPPKFDQGITGIDLRHVTAVVGPGLCRLRTDMNHPHQRNLLAQFENCLFVATEPTSPVFEYLGTLGMDEVRGRITIKGFGNYYDELNAILRVRTSDFPELPMDVTFSPEDRLRAGDERWYREIEPQTAAMLNLQVRGKRGRPVDMHTAHDFQVLRRDETMEADLAGFEAGSVPEFPKQAAESPNSEVPISPALPASEAGPEMPPATGLPATDPSSNKIVPGMPPDRREPVAPVTILPVPPL